MKRISSRSDRPARRPHERGTVLIVTLMLLAMLALGSGSYLMLNLNAARQARQGYRQNASFHLAEAGAEEAVWSLNRGTALADDAWTGWTRQGPAAWRKFSGFDFGGDTHGTVKVYVSNASPTGSDKPTAVAQAVVETTGYSPSTRMIEVTLGRRSYFANAILALDVLRFAGTNTSVDSWDSDPDQDPATTPVSYSATTRSDRGSIATSAVQNYAMLVNQASIWGSVATGGAAPEVGFNGSIRGRNTPVDVQIDPALVNTDFSANLPLLTAPVDGTPLLSVGETLGTEGMATKWRCASITLRSDETLTILGDVTLVLTASLGTAIELTGNASIIVTENSSLTVYAESDIKIAGKGLANGNTRPVSCRIFGTGPAGQAIKVAGNGALKAALYAPNADVTVNGNGDIMGAIAARTVTFTGNALFHYDESLAREGDSMPFAVTRWRELTGAAEKQEWQTVFAGW
jgi:Tfp pilus assembly protein PilX